MELDLQADENEDQLVLDGEGKCLLECRDLNPLAMTSAAPASNDLRGRALGRSSKVLVEPVCGVLGSNVEVVGIRTSRLWL